MSNRPVGSWRLLAALPVLLVGVLAAAVGVPWSQEAAAAKPKDGKTLQVLFVYAPEKEEWAKDVTLAFNKTHPRIADGDAPFIRVRAVAANSTDMIDDVLAERVKADVLSPASSTYFTLGNADSQAKYGKDLIGPTRSLVRTPLVVAMWRPMAESLGWPDKAIGWADLRALAAAKDGWGSRGKPQWGSFQFVHARPDRSGGGLGAVFGELYAAAGKTHDLTADDVSGARDFLRDLEKSAAHYGGSTTALADEMFTGGPQVLSAAVLGENQVIDSYGDKYRDKLAFPVVAIYPKEGTVWADHPVGIVQRDWVTAEHREAAQLFIDYLFKEEPQQKAMKYGFRPGSDQVKLAAPIDAEHGVNPDEPKVVLDVPGADVLRAGLDAWRRNKKHAHVILVMDRSVGMNFSDKMTNAKAGARQILSTLGDEDRLGLLAFSDAAVWAEKDAPMKDARDPMTRAIDALSPGGETALYDAIGEAYGELQNCAQPDEINALVVLTSGDDNRSKTRLDELLGRIRADAGRKAIRVFTIAYGDEAGEKALQAIAEAGQGKCYRAAPENIRAVFQEIATSF